MITAEERTNAMSGMGQRRQKAYYYVKTLCRGTLMVGYIGEQRGDTTDYADSYSVENCVETVGPKAITHLRRSRTNSLRER